MQEQLTEHDGATEDNKEMSCLRDEGAAPHDQAYVVTGPIDAEHDYDEPYFEPASEFDTLLEQLKELAVINIQESSLRSVEKSCRCRNQGGTCPPPPPPPPPRAGG